MQIQIISIGNSKGIRLPKSILEKYNIKDKINLILKEKTIEIEAIEEPRKGWEQSFMEMHQNNDDKLVIDDVFDDENLEEWN